MQQFSFNQGTISFCKAASQGEARSVSLWREWAKIDFGIDLGTVVAVAPLAGICAGGGWHSHVSIVPTATRTTYFLEWITSDSLRRTVHKGTTKIERHHRFAKHLAFGGSGHLRTDDPADQEKPSYTMNS